MRLLFDQNLSFKLCQRLAALYPESTRAGMIEMDRVPDWQLWEYPRQNDFTIVTQDGDFSDLSCLHRWPPKIVWLRCGNQPTRIIENLPRSHHAAIIEFKNDPSTGVLEIW
jgi:predicted nuclease of predicted toxin-antitoxin system